MNSNVYLKWMAENTETDWSNDSAVLTELDVALGAGATGCTSNPPLTFQTLMHSSEIFDQELLQRAAGLDGDQRAVALIQVVVSKISDKLLTCYESSNGQRGYIRAQVQPSLSDDAEKMLEMGKKFASWAPNVKVKIPGTAAGMTVLEELAALGIPTNPTVCVSISQMIAAAEANDRGAKRALRAGIEPAHSTSALVIGRLQDYLKALAQSRDVQITDLDLEWAVLSVAKRCYRLFKERGYGQTIMPAAFRSAMQVAQLVGSDTEMTIHPKIQQAVAEADEQGHIQRNRAIDDFVDDDAVERVRRSLPEFSLAYEENALTVEDFDTFGATTLTLENFDTTGWKKLRDYKVTR